MNNSHIYGAVTTWDINKANSLLRSQDGNSICIHLVQSSLNKNMFIAESEERFFLENKNKQTAAEWQYAWLWRKGKTVTKKKFTTAETAQLKMLLKKSGKRNTVIRPTCGDGKSWSLTTTNTHISTSVVIFLCLFLSPPPALLFPRQTRRRWVGRENKKP